MKMTAQTVISTQEKEFSDDNQYEKKIQDLFLQQPLEKIMSHNTSLESHPDIADVTT